MVESLDDELALAAARIALLALRSGDRLGSPEQHFLLPPSQQSYTFEAAAALLARLPKPIHVAARSAGGHVVIEWRVMNAQEIADRREWLDIADRRGALSFIRRQYGDPPTLRVVDHGRRNSLLVLPHAWEIWQRDYSVANCWHRVGELDSHSDATPPIIELSCDSGETTLRGSIVRVPNILAAFWRRARRLWERRAE